MDGQGLHVGDDVPIGGSIEAIVTKLRDLERRLREEPENLGLRVAFAGALREAGRHAEAVELYRSVAIAYREQGRTKQAIAVCRSVLEIAPDDARCRALLAGLTPSVDDTPLPPAMPHHVADPTSRVRKVSESDLPMAEDAPTRPGTEDGSLPEVSGIANAARRISASLIGAGTDRPGTVRDPDADAVPQAREDDDDDQTQPRDLPLGLRRPRPPVRPPLGAPIGGAATQGPLAFAFFAPLPADRRAAVLSRFSRRSVPPGTVVIRQGELAPSFVLVASGRLDVRVDRVDRPGAPIALGAIGPGEHIGEAPLLSRAPARASVVAATEAELLLLSPRDFFEIAGAFPALWAALKELAERRTREHDARLSPER
jgi:cyclic nucleotide-binding protein